MFTTAAPARRYSRSIPEVLNTTLVSGVPSVASMIYTSTETFALPLRIFLIMHLPCNTPG